VFAWPGVFLQKKKPENYDSEKFLVSRASFRALSKLTNLESRNRTSPFVVGSGEAFKATSTFVKVRGAKQDQPVAERPPIVDHLFK